jgi:hypothetical protein
MSSSNRLASTSTRERRAIIATLAFGMLVLINAGVASAQRVAVDFNGDGLDDLAVGAPFANGGRGSVSIFVSVRGAGFAANTPTFTLSGSEAGENYGSALAVADFNLDGRFELLVGAPFWKGARGSVDIIRFVDTPFGSVLPDVLARLSREARRVSGPSLPYNRFGSALATGFFNDDQYPDLAVGVPGDGIAGKPDVGTVQIFYGGDYGLLPYRDHIVHQDSPGVGGVAQAGDQFGSALTTGDFNGDGWDDLAVGVPFEDTNGFVDRGAVNVVFGDRYGLSQRGQLLQPPLRGAGMRFGAALAAGDFDGDDYPDLAIGAPRAYGERGYVTVRYGFRGGLTDTLVLDGGQLGENRERFGSALAAGDFNGDRFDDLAVGSPRRDSRSVPNSGSVTILYGMDWYGGIPRGFAAAHVWDQNSYGVRDLLEPGDEFGAALTVGDFDGNGVRDLAIGIPFEDVGTAPTGIDAGAVAVLFGSGIGVTSAGNQLLVGSRRHAGMRFGTKLSH